VVRIALHPHDAIPFEVDQHTAGSETGSAIGSDRAGFGHRGLPERVDEADDSRVAIAVIARQCRGSKEPARARDRGIPKAEEDK